MEPDAVERVADAAEAAVGVFERDAAHEAVHLVAVFEEVLGQVAAVLPGDACDECSFHGWKSGYVLSLSLMMSAPVSGHSIRNAGSSHRAPRALSGA